MPVLNFSSDWDDVDEEDLDTGVAIYLLRTPLISVSISINIEVNEVQEISLLTRNDDYVFDAEDPAMDTLYVTCYNHITRCDEHFSLSDIADRAFQQFEDEIEELRQEQQQEAERSDGKKENVGSQINEPWVS